VILIANERINISFSSKINYYHYSLVVFYNILVLYSLIEVGFQCIYVFSAIVWFISHFVLNIIRISGIREICSLLFLDGCPR
jgi:hypothetical protein